MKTTAIIMIVFALLISGCASAATSSAPAPTTSAANTTISPTQPGETASLAAEWNPDGVISDGEYSGSNTYRDFTVNWRSDGQMVYLGVKVKTTGWIAIGIQPGTRMKDADMIIGFVRGGETQVFDQFSTGDYGPHGDDTSLGGTNDIEASQAEKKMVSR